MTLKTGTPVATLPGVCPVFAYSDWVRRKV